MMKTRQYDGESLTDNKKFGPGQSARTAQADLVDTFYREVLIFFFFTKHGSCIICNLPVVTNIIQSFPDHFVTVITPGIEIVIYRIL